AIGAAVFFRAFDADAVEALLDRVVGLIDGDDSFARGHHGLGGFGELVDAHGDPGDGLEPRIIAEPPRPSWNPAPRGLGPIRGAGMTYECVSDRRSETP